MRLVLLTLFALPAVAEEMTLQEQRNLSRLAIAPSVKVQEDFGALQAPAIPPRTCLDSAARGCAVQAVRLRAHSPDQAGTPAVRRRFWLVEDADGTTLQCSDGELTRCD